MKSLNSQNSHVGHSNLIHGLTQIRRSLGLIDSKVDLFIYLSERIRGPVHKKFDVWTGPKSCFHH